MCRRPCLTSCAMASARASGVGAPGASPARRSPRSRAPPRAAARRCAATGGPCGASGSASMRVDPRAQLAAGLRPETARVQAHLVGQAGDAQARQAARDAHGVHRAQQLERPMLGAFGARDARHRAVAEQHGLGQGAALEHVEAVGQQRARPRRLVALPHARRPAAPRACRRTGCAGRGRLRRAPASAAAASRPAATCPSHR